MDEFLELEKKCKKLKYKKIIKYLLLFILLFVLIIGLYLFMKPKQKHQRVIHKENKTNVKIVKPLKPNPPIKDINKSVKKIKIKETKKQIKTIQPKKITEENKTIKIIKPIDIPKWNVEFNLDEINVTQPPKQNKETQQKKEKIKLHQQKQVFKTQTITFDKALKLAKFYYNNDDYENSIKWCKIASNIDNTNEEIWKLYALNLEKLNQKDKAIKVLKTYLKYKDSPELKFILQRLEK